jgi:hypothetical protein
MLIHAIQADEGDCILLQGAASPSSFMLVDGGPRGIYSRHLAEHLNATLGSGGRLETVVLSHVDKDHVMGILDMLAEIERADADGAHRPFEVGDIWHNSFGQAIDDERGSLTAGLRSMVAYAGRSNMALSHSGAAFLGIKEGAALRRLARKLKLPINGAFGGGLVSVGRPQVQPVPFDSGTITVVGPTEANLRQLEREWREWIAANIDAFAEGDTAVMANSDRSVPNLSSIVLLVSTSAGAVLLTGDARGDHILQGLEETGAVAPGERLPLRVLKVQHHGSDRNVTKGFFRRLPADIYLISADGKYGNPDIEALKMLVDVAHEEGRRPLIVVTNETDSVRELRAARSAETYGYTLEVRPPTSHAIVLDVISGRVVGEGGAT